MTLKDLCQQMLDDDVPVFQIVTGDDKDWDIFDTVLSDSILLVPFLDCQIVDLTAISKNVFRFELKGYEDKIDAFK